MRRTTPEEMRPTMGHWFPEANPTELALICELGAEIADDPTVPDNARRGELIARINKLAEEGSSRSIGYWYSPDRLTPLIGRDFGNAESDSAHTAVHGAATESESTEDASVSGFQDAYAFAALAGGEPCREITLRFPGETAGAAIAGLAEWATANELLDSPFIVEAIRLKLDSMSDPEFVAIVTVMDVR